MISHRSLLENVKTVSRVTNMTDDPKKVPADSVGVCWLPHPHDMGLLGSYLMTPFAGLHMVCFSPLDFITNRLLWQDTIVRYDACVTSGPNFAYGLVAKRAQQAGPSKQGLWSRMRYVCNAAEPVDPNVLEAMRSVLGVPDHAIGVGYAFSKGIDSRQQHIKYSIVT